MKTSSSLVLTACVLTLGVPGFALAQSEATTSATAPTATTVPKKTTGTYKFTRKDPCLIHREDKERERCRARNLNVTSERFPQIEDAFANRIDSWRRKRQDQEYQKRLDEMMKQKRISPTLKEKVTEGYTDINTERLPYLNEVKTKQYECMLKPPGRQRSVCLDELKDWTRKQVVERRKVAKPIVVE